SEIGLGRVAFQRNAVADHFNRRPVALHLVQIFLVWRRVVRRESEQPNQKRECHQLHGDSFLSSAADKDTQTISLSLRANTQRLANAGCDQTTMRPRAASLASRILNLSIS